MSADCYLRFDAGEKAPAAMLVRFGVKALPHGRWLTTLRVDDKLVAAETYRNIRDVGYTIFGREP